MNRYEYTFLNIQYSKKNINLITNKKIIRIKNLMSNVKSKAVKLNFY